MDGETVLGQLDGGPKHLRETHCPKTSHRLGPRVHHRRNARRQITIAGNQIDPVLLTPRYSERFRRPAHAADGERFLLFGGIDQCRHFPADAVIGGLQQAQTKAHRRSRIDRIAAPLHDAKSRSRGQIVTRGEIMLRIAMVSHDVDREAMLTHRGEHIYAAGFHGRSRIFRMTTSFVKRALVAQSTRPGSQSQRLVITGQKKLTLQSRSDFLGFTAGRLEQHSPLVFVQHAASLFRHGRVRRTDQTRSKASATELTLPTHPTAGFYGRGIDHLRRQCSQCNRLLNDLSIRHPGRFACSCPLGHQKPSFVLS